MGWCRSGGEVFWGDVCFFCWFGFSRWTCITHEQEPAEAVGSWAWVMDRY